MLAVIAAILSLLLPSITALHINLPLNIASSSSSRRKQSRMSRSSNNIIASNQGKYSSINPLQATASDTIDPDYSPKSNESKPSLNKNINIPNALSILRIICIPFFSAFFLAGKRNIALTIYILSCITDFVDGYLARQWNQMTTFGAFIDPVADKLMVCTALILLLCQFPVWWYALPVAITTCREIFVSALRELMADRGKRSVVKVGAIGKLKTACQMISTALLIAASPAASDSDMLGGSAAASVLLLGGLLLLYASTALSVVSAVEYFTAAWPTIYTNDAS